MTIIHESGYQSEITRVLEPRIFRGVIFIQRVRKPQILIDRVIIVRAYTEKRPSSYYREFGKSLTKAPIVNLLKNFGYFHPGLMLGHRKGLILDVRGIA